MLNTEKELKKFADTVIRNAKRNLKRKNKKASGDLLHSLDYELEVYKNSFSLQFFMMDYGTFIDEGVSGKKKKYNTPYSFTNKMPPSKPIKNWIKKRGLKGRDKRGRFITDDSLSFLIRRSILNKGIKPTQFFTKPFQNAFKRIDRDLIDEFGLDIDNWLEETLNG